MLYSNEQREQLPPNARIRCVLVLEHVLLRQGLRRLLEDETDIEVTEAGTPAEALHRVFELRPDVVITDSVFFEAGADRVRQLITQISPDSEVVFLTLDSTVPEKDSDGIHCAQRQTSVQELVRMVREAHRGKSTDAQPAPHEFVQGSSPKKTGSRPHGLTTREREVLRLLAEGRTVRSVADSLGLSMKTVDAHKFNLMRKLGIHNKAELVMRAIQERVLKLPVNF